MRILYFNYEWDLRESSGAGTHVAELIRGLRALGHEVIPVDRHRAPEDRPAAGGGGSAGGRSRVQTQLSRYLHEPAALMRAVRGIATEIAIVRRTRPDIVLTRYSLHRFSSLVAARRCGVPIVFELNAPVGFEYRAFLKTFRLLPRFAEWSEVRTLALADGVFVVSTPLRDHLVARGVPAHQIAIVPNGADVERFRPGPATPGARARLGDCKVVVGFVGSFASFHGVESLRQMIVAVAPARPDVGFLLVGKGARAAELEAWCREQGFGDRVIFSGFVSREDVPAMLNAMDIVLAPYVAQEFFYFSPIKLFEYMAAGRAVLAAALGQIAEVIDDGRNGLLYDPIQPAALGAQLLRLIDDVPLRQRLGSEARRTVEEHYTWGHNAQRVADALAKACGRHGAARKRTAPVTATGTVGA